MKKVIWGVLLLAAVAVLIFVLRKDSKAPLAPIPNANVLLITIDTLRPDHLSCYGSLNQTPNIDAIARSGILFENAFSQVPLTFPSHTSILTGLFPVHHGMHNNGLESLSKHEFVISNLFHQNGYKTGAVVSSFVLDRKFGLAESFDVYDDKMERLPGISSNFDVERRGNESYEAAIRILKGFGANRWFLWLHFYDPHTPYSPPAPLEGYDGEIQFVDAQIGKLRQWLKAQRLNQNLILTVMSDHGESLGEHGEQTHGFFVYNSTLRIPLLLIYPRSPANKRVAATAAAVDVTPTLLALAGIQDPEHRDGESLLPLIDGGMRQHDIYFESHYAELLGWNGLQGIFQSNWKLISTTRSELYDWKTDEIESTNLYSQKEDMSRSLKTELDQFSETKTPAQQQPDAETLEKLKSLGYVSTTSIAKKKGTGDPKDKIGVWVEYEKSLQLKNAGKSGEALRVLESLTQKEPLNNFFRISLARGYREAGNLTGAIEQLQIAGKTDPSDANAYHEMALDYKDQHNYAEALRAEEAALALDPGHSEFHAVKGIILVEMGRFEQAQTEFGQALKTDPNNAIAWNNLGNALRATNQLEQAENAYRKAIDLSPHYAYPLNGLATVLIRQNHVQEALPYLEKALDLDPKFVEVYLNLGIAYHTLHQTDKAKTLYRTFLKLAPETMKKERESARLLLSQLP